MMATAVHPYPRPQKKLPLCSLVHAIDGGSSRSYIWAGGLEQWVESVFRAAMEGEVGSRQVGWGGGCEW